MDTVLGLSVTPSTIGWVLAEGHGADGTILDHQELTLRAAPGIPATGTAEQIVEEVLQVDTAAAARDQRLRVIGVTWNDEASAQAALVLEALTDAGFDNVVPIRYSEAIETLAQAIGPVIGYEQAAVCVLDDDWATVVMVDTHDGEAQIATKHVRGGFDGLSRWLTGMFERNGWQPGGVVVVGADDDIDELSWQLEKTLPVPVFVQSMAQVTIARGAALSAARSTEFTDEQLVQRLNEPVPALTPKRQLSYAGAVSALVAGAVTFVGSVSLAVGIHVGPASVAAPPKHGAHSPPHQIVEAATAVAPLPAAPPTRVAPQPKPPAGEPVSEPSAPEEQPEAGGGRQSDGGGRQPYLTRVLEHIPGDTGDSAVDSTPHDATDPQP